jgi:hypothetical protein
MKVYPHWLDGEFLRLASAAEATTQASQGVQAVRMMKLHALLGTEFILNDVQVFDSAGVLMLFGDRETREFLRHHTDLLELRVFPDPSSGNSPFDLATRGLKRTQVKGWESSLLKSPEATIRLSEEILNDGFIDPERPSKTIAKYPGQTSWLNAIRHSLSYFASYDHPRVLPSTKLKTDSYWDVLQELQLQPNLANNERESVLLRDTIQYIEKRIPDPHDRSRRSLLKPFIDRDGVAKRFVRHNVVLAWNTATQRTLQPDGGSITSLPDAVTPGTYLEDTSDTLVPFRSKEGLFRHLDPGRASFVANVECQIDSLGWSDIARALQSTSVQETMAELDIARASGEPQGIGEALRAHTASLARVLLPRPAMPWQERVVWVVFGSFVVSLGPATFGEEIKDLVWRAAAGASGLVIGEAVRSGRVALKRSEFANTLRQAAQAE